MPREGEREERVMVRGLKPGDLEAVTALDARIVGRSRDDYFKVKLAQNLAETGVKVSLAAELDGAFCGFLLARVYYGEFGMLEPTAVLDTLGVHPEMTGQGVGSALMRQLRTNLAALGVSRLQTEVDWDNQRLLAFLHDRGFTPAPRYCLDLELTAGGTDRA